MARNRIDASSRSPRQDLKAGEATDAGGDSGFPGRPPACYVPRRAITAVMHTFSKVLYSGFICIW